jgi:hypothetical protein
LKHARHAREYVSAARTIGRRTANPHSRFDSDAERRPTLNRQVDEGGCALKHYMLMMEFSETYAARRAEFRDAHLTRAWAAAARGELILAGALTDPLDTGLILFKADSPEVVERFARDDPYIANGLVTAWRVRQWATVVGDAASEPLRPV